MAEKPKKLEGERDADIPEDDPKDGEILEREGIDRNGEKISGGDVSNKDLMRINRILLRKVNRMENELDRMKDQVSGPGGAQPSKEFSTSELHTEKAGQKVLSDLGLELKEAIDDHDVDKHEFDEIMKSHGWTQSSNPTLLNRMKAVAAHFEDFKFESGSSGGRNEPSKIVWNE